MDRRVKYYVEPSQYPDKEGDYILFMESETEHGYNYQRVFKGTEKKCNREKRKRTRKEK